MMHYIGSLESAESIKKVLSEAFAKEGLILIFHHIRSDDSSNTEVEFMDVNHMLDPDDQFGFITRDFIKPTATERLFLHGASYHPISTFKSILKGESLRM